MNSAVEAAHTRVRPMKKEDLSDVVRIEAQGFPDPWPEQSFRECLRFGYHCRVLEQADVIQAYGVMAIGDQEAHLFNLCVDSNHRRCSLGRTLLHHLLEEALGAGVETVFLEVRSSNKPAIRLYRNTGFFQVGVRQGYYRDEGGHEDALVLAWKPSSQRRSLLTRRPAP